MRDLTNPLLEDQILATMLAHPDEAPVVLQELGEQFARCWTGPDRPHVARAILNLRADLATPSIEAVASTLQVLGEVDAASYLATHILTEANIQAAAALPAAAGRLRELTNLRFAQRAMEAGAIAIETASVQNLAELQTRIRPLFNDCRPSGAGISYAKDIKARLLGVYDKRAADPEFMPGVPTGSPKLDHRMGGLPYGGYTVIAARPGVGKSVLAGQIAMATARKGIPVVFFTHEMIADMMWTRLACNVGRLSYKMAEKGRFHAATRQRYADALEEVQNLPIVIVDDTHGDAQRYADTATYLHHQMGPGLTIVDYIQRQGIPGFHGPKTDELSKVSGIWLNNVISTKCAGLMVAQLNRTAAATEPLLHQIKDCGTIEQDAMAVLLLWRPGNDDKEAAANVVHCNLAKMRNGSLTRVVFHFSGYCMRMREWDTPTDKELTTNQMKSNETWQTRDQGDLGEEEPAPPRPVSDKDIPKPEI